ncbi:MAG: DUF2183 domain-containing protein [Planctomycetaceae bacterium]|nr:DUF2183 domain-containing protein [Planctomycetaceae bacterium]
MSNTPDPERSNGKAAVHQRETVQFYRSYAHHSPLGDCWHLEVQGRVFAPSRRHIRKRALMFLLKSVVRPETQTEEHQLFLERAQLFLTEHRRGKSIPITIAEQAHALPDTTENGHFEATLTMQSSELGPSIVTLPDGRRFVQFCVELPEADGRLFAGDVELVSPQGISVISDVDDTIKISNVADRKELLQNTFTRHFRSVDGMPALYQRWADLGCSFHYVSASPWPLYEPLDQWLNVDQFPAGSVHLRYVKLRELRRDREGHGSFRAKRAAIEQILRSFPGRRFILCGDAGERDAELYALIGRTFGNQVAHICIRQVQGRHNPNGLSMSEISHLDPGREDRWTLFNDALELEPVLDKVRGMTSA